MNRLICRRAFLLMLTTLAALQILSNSFAQDAGATLVVKATTDHKDALYRVGESVEFLIEATQSGTAVAEGKVTCNLSRDGVEPRSTQTVELKDGRAVVKGSLGEPGFLQLRASIGKSTAIAAAGFEPLQLKPSLPMPEDFVQFWDNEKAKLAAVPVKAKLSAVDTPAKNVDAFDVQVDCLGAPVSGYFGRPKDAKPKSLPAILFVHGAGVGGSSLGNVHWANREGGMLAMDINAHGIPNGQPAEFYKKLAEGELKDYRYVGRDDREQCYFKGMFLRLVRAIDFLTEQPEWDGKTMIVYGSSQGGFQAFAAAGLDSRVSFFCAGVPAGCDHTGASAKRINGWPKLVKMDSDGKPDAAGELTARYFDCVNFAAITRCRGAAVTVGFIDTTCPPTSVYAAYNALTIPKTLNADPVTGHTSTPAASKFMQEAAYAHVRAMK